MNRIQVIAMNGLLPWLVACLPCSNALAQDRDALVADALAPLPEQLRAEAKVVQTLDDGEQVVLKEGSNGITCRPDIPGPLYLVRCHPSELEPMLDRLWHLLEFEDVGPEEARDLVSSEIEAGTLPRPAAGMAQYLIAGPDRESATQLTVIFIPMSTPDQLGLRGNADNADNADPDRPWLMWGGTEQSHIMLPGM
jgi:hypothetical protein